jgi:hypothetical protein
VFFVDKVEAAVAKDGTVVDKIIQPIFRAGVVKFCPGDKIPVLLHHGIDVSNDRQPALENVFDIVDNNNNNNNNNNNITCKVWGFRCLCERH